VRVFRVPFPTATRDFFRPHLLEVSLHTRGVIAPAPTVPTNLLQRTNESGTYLPRHSSVHPSSVQQVGVAPQVIGFNLSAESPPDTCQDLPVQCRFRHAFEDARMKFYVSPYYLVSIPCSSCST